LDLFTHALLGAKVAHAAATERTCLRLQERLVLGAAAAAFPDIDFVGFLVNPLIFLADWHQGPTHSLVLLPLWAALIAALFVGLMKRWNAFAEALLVSSLGLASHILADLITVYGTMALYPLTRWRPSLDIIFVVDPVFTAIVLTGLVASVWSGRRRIAGTGLTMLVGYVAAQAWLQERALDIGRAALAEQGFAIEKLSAIPQPFSPFNWKLIASNETLHREAYVNLIGHPPLVPPLPGLRPLHDIAAAFRSPARLDWQTRYRHGARRDLRPMVERLWADPRFAPFRRFAVYPGVSGIEHQGLETCVWFTDLRYDLPTWPDTFRFGFCRVDMSAPWELYRLRYFSAHARQPIAP
jgi:inner membrane protein